MLGIQVANSVIDYALSLGADFAELFVEENHVNTISTLSAEVQAVRSGIDFGIGIRLVYGHKVLYGYTNKIEDTELKRIVRELATKDRRDPSTQRINFDYRKISEAHPAKKPLSKDPWIESKIAFLLNADQNARATSNSISQTSGSCMQREQKIAIFNSEGLHTDDTRHYIRSSLTAYASDGIEQATGSSNDGGLKGWEIEDEIDAEKTGDEAARQALVNLSAKACPSGRMPVVLGNGLVA